MNRRAFLASTIAAFALDPERLLWRPGAKTISIPSRSPLTYSICDLFSLDGRCLFPHYNEQGTLTSRIIGYVPVKPKDEYWRQHVQTDGDIVTTGYDKMVDLTPLLRTIYGLPVASKTPVNCRKADSLLVGGAVRVNFVYNNPTDYACQPKSCLLTV